MVNVFKWFFKWVKMKKIKYYYIIMSSHNKDKIQSQVNQIKTYRCKHNKILKYAKVAINFIVIKIVNCAVNVKNNNNFNCRI